MNQKLTAYSLPARITLKNTRREPFRIRGRLQPGTIHVILPTTMDTLLSEQTMNRTYIASLLLLLVSCTTMEDFHAMSPDERAENVCSATIGYRQRKRSLADLNAQITEKQNLLATGYRVYETCQIVSVAVPENFVSCEGLTGSELKACKKGNASATKENRRVCEQTPVPIDYTYESSMLRELKMARENQLQMHELQTDNCLSRASSLSAEEAYLRYKGNMEP